MIELQKEDIKKLDLIIEEISDASFFGIDFIEFEKKQPNFFINIKAEKEKDLEYSSHKRREYERLACIIEKYDCGKVDRPNPLDGRILNIKSNSNTLQFKKQGGFEKLYSELNKVKKRENFEFKKSKTDFELAEKMLKEFSKTKWFARIGFIIAIVLMLKELYILIWK
jgi:hypothetical protein